MAEIRRSPVDMENLPLFTGFYTSQVVFSPDFERTINSMSLILCLDLLPLPMVFFWCQNSCRGRITRPYAIATHQQVLGQSLGFLEKMWTHKIHPVWGSSGWSFLCLLSWDHFLMDSIPWIHHHKKNQPFGGTIF